MDIESQPTRGKSHKGDSKTHQSSPSRAKESKSGSKKKKGTSKAASSARGQPQSATSRSNVNNTQQGRNAANTAQRLENLRDGEATWDDLCEVCCLELSKEWQLIFVSVLVFVFFLYFFLLALELVSVSSRVLTACKSASLFNDDSNPVSSLMAGILASALIQSSSTASSIIVSLMGAGISARQGIFMIMGVNIGTTITNTIVALGHVHDPEMRQRAFAGATLHDIYNILTVAIVFPLEVGFGVFYKFTKACVRSVTTESDDYWHGPINRLVRPLGNRIIMASPEAFKMIASGASSCKNGGGLYPTECVGEPSYHQCKTGLIGCDPDTGRCPAFFTANGEVADDQVSGGVILFIAICMMLLGLAGLVYLLQQATSSMSSAILYRASHFNGYVAIGMGCVVTLVVQSSALVTSTLTPLVGVGALPLEQMYPLTLGANLGAAFTSIMAAMAVEGNTSLQVALAQVCFNLVGIAIFYPIRYMRMIPLDLARHVGTLTRYSPRFPFFYTFSLFFAIPLMFLGLCMLFQEHKIGYTVLGVLLTMILAYLAIYGFYRYNFQHGYEDFIEWTKRRERRRLALQSLHSDVEYVRLAVGRLKDHTGYQQERHELLVQVGDEIAFKRGDHNDIDNEAISDHSTDE
jgi:solute carrier family 34 (sodium-dependent phosphate cotransporter)